MALIKNIFFVCLLTLAMLVALEVILFAAFSVRDLASDGRASKKTDNPNQNEETFQFQNDTESFQGYPYKAFVGWESPMISSKTLNIDEDLRRVTTNPEPESATKVHFFGGSTMWGHSVSDKNTIPSQFAELSGKTSINYGEQAYNSRQSLNRLLNNLSDIQSGDTVVFFDGVNDVYHNCLGLNSANGHPREGFIKAALENKSQSTSALWSIIQSSSINRFARGIGQKLDSNSNDKNFSELNRCDEEEYAEDVASFLVDSWAATEAIVRSKGARFVCVLQPNPYTLSSEPFSHNANYETQIHQVYPKIRAKAQSLGCFTDYSALFQEDHYIDHCCHVNAKGNLEIARQFAKDLN